MENPLQIEAVQYIKSHCTLNEQSQHNLKARLTFSKTKNHITMCFYHIDEFRFLHSSCLSPNLKGANPITEFQASIEVSGRMGSIHHPCKHKNSGVKLKGKQTMLLRGSWKHNKPTQGKEEFFSIVGTFLTLNTKYILGILSINTVM